jgi:hypothetical protein
MVDIPADVSASVPPSTGLEYVSPDLVVKLDNTGAGGASYLASPGSEEMRFASYDTVTQLPFAGTTAATETVVPNGSPGGGGNLQFVLGPGIAVFGLSSETPGIVPATLEVDIPPGGPPVALTELGPPTGGLSLGFADPAAPEALLSYGVPVQLSVSM